MTREIKRMINRLNWLLFTVEEMEVAGEAIEVQGAHLGKWAVLQER